MGGDGSPKIYIFFYSGARIGSDSVLVGGWDCKSNLPFFTDDQLVDEEFLFKVPNLHQKKGEESIVIEVPTYFLLFLAFTIFAFFFLLLLLLLLISF